jgi:hypothetical protein
VPFKAKPPIKRRPPHDPKDAGLVWVPNPGTRKETWKLVRATTGLGQIQDPLGAALGEPSYFDLGWENVFVAGCFAIGADPYSVCGLLLNESGFNPSATNAEGCVGINQQCSGSQTFTADYSASQYVQLTVSEALPYVFASWEGWLQQYGMVTVSAAELYAINFLPALFQPGMSSSTPLASAGDAYYSGNQSLDPDGTGSITLDTLQTVIDNQLLNNPLSPYLIGAVSLAGGPVAAPTWPWLAAGSFAAGIGLFYAARKYRWRLPFVGTP